MKPVAVACVLIMLAPPAGADCRAGHRLSDAELLRTELPVPEAKPAQAVLGDAHHALVRVRVFRQNVFPDATHWLARAANRFNPVTRTWVVRAALPFTEGEPVSARQIEEAERVLRAKPFLFDAGILVRRVCDAGVELDVVVRDVWTLDPSLELSRSGGDTRSGFGLNDVNLLGLGKAFELSYRRDASRDTVLARFRDPNFMGSRWTARLGGASVDDGEQAELALARPFFSLDSRWSFGVQTSHFRRVEDLELLSEDLTEFDANSAEARVFVGRSTGRSGFRVNRYLVGLAYEEDRYEFEPGFADTSRYTERRVYPFVGWQHITDRFVERTNFLRVGVVEDFDVGIRSQLELGYSSNALGGRGNAWLYAASATGTRILGERHLVRGALRLRGRFSAGSEGTEDLWLRLGFTHVWRLSERWRWIADAEFVATRDLPLHRQLTQGGDTGLRAYPSRYQVGDHRYRGSLEVRYLPDIFPWRLFRVGVAAFADVGRAWYEERAPEYLPERRGDHFGTLYDVGLGLRIESVRTRRDRVIAIDLAQPLVDGPGVDGVELSVSVRQAF